MDGGPDFKMSSSQKLGHFSRDIFLFFVCLLGRLLCVKGIAIGMVWWSLKTKERFLSHWCEKGQQEATIGFTFVTSYALYASNIVYQS